MICTGERNVLYVFLMEPPESTAIPLVPLDSPAEKAVLLNTGKPLQAELFSVSENKEKVLHIRRYPADELHGEIPVLKITFQEPLSSVLKRAAWHHYAW